MKILLEKWQLWENFYNLKESQSISRTLSKVNREKSVSILYCYQQCVEVPLFPKYALE